MENEEVIIPNSSGLLFWQSIGEPPALLDNSEIKVVLIERISSFPNHPFKVKHDDEYEILKESIKREGLINPVIVRQIKADKEKQNYEMISGHRRLEVARELGMIDIKARVLDLDDDTAMIFMTDSNLQREKLLPSEKAFAFRMRKNAIEHRNNSVLGTCRQIVGKGENQQINGENERTIERFIRLTYLIEEYLQMIDDGKLGVIAGVNISFISKESQRLIYEISQGRRISTNDSLKLKRAYETGKISEKWLTKVFLSEKKTRINEIKLDKIDQYFPDTYTKREIQKTIYVLLQKWREEQKL